MAGNAVAYSIAVSGGQNRRPLAMRSYCSCRRRSHHCTGTFVAMSETAPEPRLFALDDETTLAMQVMPDGTAYFAVPPAVQAQLDRIEAMLGKLFEPKDKVVDPDTTWIINYIQDVCQIAPVQIGKTTEGSWLVRTWPEVPSDAREWIESQFPEIICFSFFEASS
jgi:hypothetical protein